MDKLIQKSTEDSQQALFNFFMQAPAIMAILKGPQHVFELANPDYLRTIGNREVIGKTVREALPEVEGQGFFELLDSVYNTGEPFIGKEMPVKIEIKEMEEGIFMLIVLYQAFRDQKDKIVGILVFAYDVSEQVMARASIEKGNEKYQKLIETIDQGFCVIDARRHQEHQGNRRCGGGRSIFHRQHADGARRLRPYACRRWRSARPSISHH